VVLDATIAAAATPRAKARIVLGSDRILTGRSPLLLAGLGTLDATGWSLSNLNAKRNAKVRARDPGSSLPVNADRERKGRKFGRQPAICFISHDLREVWDSCN
jgi:hypothetical protein